MFFIVIGDTSNNYSPIRAKGQRKGSDKQWLMRRSLEPNYREKETLNVPLRLAEALRQDGWIHRSTLIWDKMGGSVVANSKTLRRNVTSIYCTWSNGLPRSDVPMETPNP